MKETIAEIEVRTYVPSNWFASKFCHVYFYGEDAEKYSSEWHEIEYEQFDEAEQKAEGIKKEIEDLEKEEKEWRQSHWFSSIRPNPFLERLDLFREKLKESEEEKFKSEYTLEREAKEFLLKSGFSPVSRTSDGHACETVTYVFKKTASLPQSS